MARNFQVFDPRRTDPAHPQPPEVGEHLVRYYGHYSNKARGLRAKQGDQADPTPSDAETNPPASEARKRWAMLIQRVYQADPLLCPKCGGTMKIIAFIEARQGQIVREILEPCGLWHDPPPRAPPRPPPPSPPQGSAPQRDPGVVFEPDPEFLEHTRRDPFDPPDLPWEA